MLNTFERKIEVFMIKYAIYSSLITQKLIILAFNQHLVKDKVAAWLLNIETKRFDGLMTYLKKLV